MRAYWKVTAAGGLAALALALGGCADEPFPLEPAGWAGVDVVAQSFAVFDDAPPIPGVVHRGGVMAGPRAGSPEHHGLGAAGPLSPLLGRWVAEAYRSVLAEHGQQAADALIAELIRLRQEALELRRAGDVEGFRAKLAEIHAEATRIILEVLGTERAEQVVAAAAGQVAALAALVAGLEEGSPVLVRLTLIADQAAAMLAAAEEALAAGDVVLALGYGARAHHLATIGIRFAQHAGGGQHRGPGMHQR
jgi:hypothetical protein